MSNHSSSIADPAESPTLRLIPREIPWLPRLSGAGLAAVAVLAVVFTIAGFQRIHHTDVWGHLSFGKWIVERGELPAADPFRDAGFAPRFVNQAWLSQVLGYFVYQGAGVDGLAFAHAALLTLTCGATMGAIRARGVGWNGAIAGGAVSFLLSLPILGALRPQLCGELGLALTMWGGTLLARRRHSLLWLPLVFVVWANLHGSAPVGLLAMLCLTIGQIAQARRLNGNWRVALACDIVRRYLLATVTCALAICVNPAGASLYLDALAFAKNANLQIITEWQPLTIQSLTGALFFSSVGLTMVLLRRSPRRWEWSEILLGLILGIATLSAIRMLAWWAIVWPWIAVPHVVALMGRRELPRLSNASTFRTLSACAIVFAALVWSPPTHRWLTGRPRSEVTAVNAQTPVFLAKALAEHEVRGPVYAPLEWADYFVWKGWGTVRPLVHSHVHLASPAVFDDYRRIAAGDAAWLEIVDYYRLRYLMVRCDQGRGLERLVTSHRRCRVLYRDQQGMLVEVLPAEKPANVHKNEHAEAADVAAFQH